VDDEKPALDNFESAVKNISEIKSLKLFSDGNKALDYIKDNQVDIAFLDMELSMTHGIQLAKEINKFNANI
jgi:two-component SAPR family response regulator